MAWTDRLQSVTADLPDNDLILLGIVAAAGVAAAATIWVLGRLLGLLARSTRASSDDEFIRRLTPPLALLGGLAVARSVLAALAARIEPEWEANTRHLMVAVFVVVAAWGVVRVVRVVLNRIGRRRERFQPATRVSGRVVSVLIFTLAFLTVLAEYGISITPLLTGLGLAALAVGLALQDTLANFFSGLWIQTEQPLSPGHYVRLEDQKIEGFVEKVGWRTTRIRMLAGNLVVIPNAKVSQSIVIDYTMPDPTMSVVMNFRFPFDVDPNRAMNLLVEEAKEAAKTFPGLLEDPAPFANATPGIGEYGITYSLIIKVRQFVDQWNAQTAVTARVWARMAREGIAIPYPTRLNLSADGKEFAPARPAKRGKAHAAPEGRDPREIEAELATQDIAAQARKEHAEGKITREHLDEAEKAAQPPAGDATPATVPAAQARAQAADAAGSPRATGSPSPPPAENEGD